VKWPLHGQRTLSGAAADTYTTHTADVFALGVKADGAVALRGRSFVRSCDIRQAYRLHLKAPRRRDFGALSAVSECEWCDRLNRENKGDIDCTKNEVARVIDLQNVAPSG
jgi:hypothetical protein